MDIFFYYVLNEQCKDYNCENINCGFLHYWESTQVTYGNRPCTRCRFGDYCRGNCTFLHRGEKCSHGFDWDETIICPFHLFWEKTKIAVIPVTSFICRNPTLHGLMEQRYGDSNWRDLNSKQLECIEKFLMLKPTKREQKVCKNGARCKFLAKGECIYKH